MTWNTHLIVMLAAWAAGIGAPLAAQELVPGRSTGRVLLLENDCGLEGDIEKLGDQFRVRRGASEVWLPADKALRLCADWDEAYAFMQRRYNLSDPDERLRLVRWCQMNNLRLQALREAKAALEMRPTHAESRQLVSLLIRSVASIPGTPVKTPPPAAAKTSAAPAAVDISADAVALFTTRVQPILLNACVQCHCGGRGGDFQLAHSEWGGRGVTQANLGAVLTQVKVDNPALSPLLIKAVSRHGAAAGAPLPDRQSIPFKALQGWIDYVLASNPQLRQQSREAIVESPRMTAEPVGFAEMKSTLLSRPQAMAVSRPTARAEFPAAPVLPPAASGVTVAKTAAKTATPVSAIAVQTENISEAANSLDPFDPAVFNRRMQPRAPESSAAK